jgi:hypothetical protein
MALTKQQAYPLYFLLATDSQLVRDLKSTPYTDANAFLLGLQQKVTVLEPSATVDPTLTALYQGPDGLGGTVIDQSPASILGAIAALSGNPGMYGGGPCPRAAEQQGFWSAVKPLA